jgi:hypothetical protein
MKISYWISSVHPGISSWTSRTIPGRLSIRHGYPGQTAVPNMVFLQFQTWCSRVPFRMDGTAGTEPGGRRSVLLYFLHDRLCMFYCWTLPSPLPCMLLTTGTLCPNLQKDHGRNCRSGGGVQTARGRIGVPLSVVGSRGHAN